MSQRATGVVAVLAASLCHTPALVVQEYEAQKSRATGLELVAALVRGPVWLSGIALLLAGFGLFTFALKAAPVSIVQPMSAAGIVFVPVLAALVLHEHPGPREIAGMASTLVAVIAILVTLGEESASGRVSVGNPLVVMGALALVFVALRAVGTRGDGGLGGAGVVAGIAAGIALGSSDSMSKLLGGWLSPGDGWTPPTGLGFAAACLLVVFGLFGFVLYQNALRSYRPITVVSALTPANMLVPILVATCVYGEPLPSGAADTPARIGGIVLILAGSWLLSTSERVAAIHSDSGPALPSDQDGCRLARPLAEEPR